MEPPTQGQGPIRPAPSKSILPVLQQNDSAPGESLLPEITSTDVPTRLPDPESLSFMRDDDCSRTSKANVKAIQEISGLDWSTFIPKDLMGPLGARYGTIRRRSSVRRSSMPESDLFYNQLPAMLLTMLYTLVHAAFTFGYDADDIQEFIGSAHKARSSRDNLLRAETMVEAIFLLFQRNAETESYNKGYAAGKKDGEMRIFKKLEEHTNPDELSQFLEVCAQPDMCEGEGEGEEEQEQGEKSVSEAGKQQTPESEDDGRPWPITPLSVRPPTCPPKFSLPQYNWGIRRQRSQEDVGDESPSSRKVSRRE
ncbi:uncharacterized protein RCC_09132 [Ramularia collo-cygni]|uniref:Uncharacterized protein n=1 Tax=Ramularia collo-cygni TaxID=112498 RepID=A0A2D3VNQ0_9PEZI|nr:uncharacterized protein RCC_09132 [Ramularia collo-cygni]CZT23418.1 uncharacterized protein RCC_09132 [Ramularia collo-cygni]